MPMLMIVTVGGSPQPVCASVKKHDPDKLVFVMSAESKKSSEKPDGLMPILQREWQKYDEGRIERLIVPNHQDIGSCIRKIRELNKTYKEWRSREDALVIVDFTGGTKCMSAALYAVAHTWDCWISYVGGEKRDKEDVGIVIDGKEQFVFDANPWQAFGYQAETTAISLFNAGAFDQAKSVLERYRQKIEKNAPHQSELTAFIRLCEVYHCWDLFAHKKALESLEQLSRNTNNLKVTIESGEDIDNVIARSRGTLDAIMSDRLALIRDLVGNARRRIQAGRYDDAVARMYRAIEAYGQFSLRSYGIEDTAKVSLEKIPLHVRANYEKNANKAGTITIALQNAYELLGAFDSPVARRFRELGFAGKDGFLSVRNLSLLAHGFEPVGRDYSELKLFPRVLELIELKETDLFIFPRLTDS